MALNRETMEALTGLSSKDAQALPRETADVSRQQQSIPDAPPQRSPGYERAVPRHNPALSEESYDPARDPRRLQDADATRDAGERDPLQPDQLLPMMVPNTRLTEEADKRRAADERYNELKSNHERLSERFSMMLEAFNANQESRVRPEQSGPPDPKMAEEDLPGYLEATNRYYAERERHLSEKVNSLEQQSNVQNQIQSVQRRAAMDEAVFSQQNPDFRNAYSWWRKSQLDELTAMGVNHQVAQQHLDTIELQISAMAQQQGQNSAERFYRAAQARGWQGQQHAPQQGRGNVTPIDRHPGYQQQFDQMPSPGYQPRAQSLENMNTGMLESRSLDEASQGGRAMPMDLEQIANMSDAEFMRKYEQIMPRIRSALR
jgi:hypothetical protein